MPPPVKAEQSTVRHQLGSRTVIFLVGRARGTRRHTPGPEPSGALTRVDFIGYNVLFIGGGAASAQVRVPDSDLLRLQNYFQATPPGQAALSVLASIIERADEVRPWSVADVGSEELHYALDAMERGEGLTPPLREMRGLLSAARPD
jgi:hypothetical protein